MGAQRGVPDEGIERSDEGHRGGNLSAPAAFSQAAEGLGQVWDLQRGCRGRPCRQRSPQFFSLAAQIAELDAVGRRAVEDGPARIVIRERNIESIAEGQQRVFFQLLLLVGDVLCFTGGSEAIAFDRLSQDDHWLSLGFYGLGVGGVHFLWVVPSSFELPERVVRHIGHHGAELWGDAEEVLSDVRPAPEHIGLVVAVDDLGHPVAEQTLVVTGQERDPSCLPRRP